MTPISRDRSSNQSVKISRVLNRVIAYTAPTLLESLLQSVAMLNGRVNHQQCLNTGVRPLSLLLHNYHLICVPHLLDQMATPMHFSPDPESSYFTRQRLSVLQRRDSDEPFITLNCTPTRSAMGARGCIVLRWRAILQPRQSWTRGVPSYWISNVHRSPQCGSEIERDYRAICALGLCGWMDDRFELRDRTLPLHFNSRGVCLRNTF